PECCPCPPFLRFRRVCRRATPTGGHHVRHRRTSTARFTLAGAGAAALAATAVLLPGAGAATAAGAPPTTAHQAQALHQAQAAQAAALVSRLGDRAAGSYYDAASRRL